MWSKRKVSARVTCTSVPFFSVVQVYEYVMCLEITDLVSNEGNIENMLTFWKRSTLNGAYVGLPVFCSWEKHFTLIMFLSRSKMTGELSGKLNKIPWDNQQIKFTSIPPKGAAILVAASWEEVQKLLTVCHIFFLPFLQNICSHICKDFGSGNIRFSYFSHLLRWVNRRLISSTYQRYHFSQEVLQQDTCLCYCTGGEKFSYLSSVSTLLLDVHNKYTIPLLVHLFATFPRLRKEEQQGLSVLLPGVNTSGFTYNFSTLSSTQVTTTKKLMN